MVFWADESRKEELAELWKISFGDDDAYIQAFMAQNLAACRVPVCEAEGRIVSAAYLLPVTCVQKGKKPVACRYLYAAATLPAFRGRGYMGKLLTFVRQNISEPVLLVPAEPSLEGYYERFGFKMWQGALLKRVEATHVEQGVLTRGKSEMLTCSELAIEAYVRKRNEILLQEEVAYMQWDAHFMAYIGLENKSCGGSQCVVFTEGGEHIAMYCMDEDVLRIQELLPWSRYAEAAEALLREKNAACAEIRVCPPVMATQALFEIAEEGYFNLVLG